MTPPKPKVQPAGPRTGEDASMMELASLRLICDQGKVLGVMPPQQARDEAAARGLLLLEVQAKAEPPIWKLVTTLPGRAAPVDKTAPSGGGPESQERGSASKQSTKRPANKEARVKELRLVDKSADHDVATKMNFARGQLEKGRIVQVRVGMGMGMRVGHGHGHAHAHAHARAHARARAHALRMHPRCTSWARADWSQARPPCARRPSWRY